MTKYVLTYVPLISDRKQFTLALNTHRNVENENDYIVAFNPWSVYSAEIIDDMVRARKMKIRADRVFTKNAKLIDAVDATVNGGIVKAKLTHRVGNLPMALERGIFRIKSIIDDEVLSHVQSKNGNNIDMLNKINKMVARESVNVGIELYSRSVKGENLDLEVFDSISHIHKALTVEMGIGKKAPTNFINTETALPRLLGNLGYKSDVLVETGDLNNYYIGDKIDSQLNAILLQNIFRALDVALSSTKKLRKNTHLNLLSTPYGGMSVFNAGSWGDALGKVSLESTSLPTEQETGFSSLEDIIKFNDSIEVPSNSTVTSIALNDKQVPTLADSIMDMRRDQSSNASVIKESDIKLTDISPALKTGKGVKMNSAEGESASIINNTLAYKVKFTELPVKAKASLLANVVFDEKTSTVFNVTGQLASKTVKAVGNLAGSETSIMDNDSYNMRITLTSSEVSDALQSRIIRENEAIVAKTEKQNITMSDVSSKPMDTIMSKSVVDNYAVIETDVKHRASMTADTTVMPRVDNMRAVNVREVANKRLESSVLKMSSEGITQGGTEKSKITFDSNAVVGRTGKYNPRPYTLATVYPVVDDYTLLKGNDTVCFKLVDGNLVFSVQVTAMPGVEESKIISDIPTDTFSLKQYSLKPKLNATSLPRVDEYKVSTSTTSYGMGSDYFTLTAGAEAVPDIGLDIYRLSRGTDAQQFPDTDIAKVVNSTFADIPLDIESSYFIMDGIHMTVEEKREVTNGLNPIRIEEYSPHSVHYNSPKGLEKYTATSREFATVEEIGETRVISKIEPTGQPHTVDDAKIISDSEATRPSKVDATFITTSDSQALVEDNVQIKHVATGYGVALETVLLTSRETHSNQLNDYVLSNSNLNAQVGELEAGVVEPKSVVANINAGLDEYMLDNGVVGSKIEHTETGSSKNTYQGEIMNREKSKFNVEALAKLDKLDRSDFITGLVAEISHGVSLGNFDEVYIDTVLSFLGINEETRADVEVELVKVREIETDSVTDVDIVTYNVTEKVAEPVEIFKDVVSYPWVTVEEGEVELTRVTTAENTAFTADTIIDAIEDSVFNTTDKEASIQQLELTNHLEATQDVNLSVIDNVKSKDATLDVEMSLSEIAKILSMSSDKNVWLGKLEDMYVYESITDVTLVSVDTAHHKSHEELVQMGTLTISDMVTIDKEILIGDLECASSRVEDSLADISAFEGTSVVNEVMEVGLEEVSKTLLNNEDKELVIGTLSKLSQNTDDLDVVLDRQTKVTGGKDTDVQLHRATKSEFNSRDKDVDVSLLDSSEKHMEFEGYENVADEGAGEKNLFTDDIREIEDGTKISSLKLSITGDDRARKELRLKSEISNAGEGNTERKLVTDSIAEIEDGVREREMDGQLPRGQELSNREVTYPISINEEGLADRSLEFDGELSSTESYNRDVRLPSIIGYADGADTSQTKDMDISGIDNANRNVELEMLNSEFETPVKGNSRIELGITGDERGLNDRGYTMAYIEGENAKKEIEHDIGGGGDGEGGEVVPVKPTPVVPTGSKDKIWSIMGKNYQAWQNWNPKKTR